MQVELLCVGKVKEKYLRQGIEEYTKRITPYCRIEIVEVEDEPDEEDPKVVLEKERQRLEKKIKASSVLVPLAVEGKQMSSEEFAAWLAERQVSGQSKVTFIIGGSHGLSPAIIQRGRLVLSLGPMTFPHQLTRLILLEQIYRAFKIIRGEPYHK